MLGHRVLITDRFALQPFLELSKRRGFAAVHDQNWAQRANYDLAFFDTLIVRSSTKVNEEFLKSFPNVQLIVSATAGFDHLDLKLLKERGIHAAHCPEAHADSATEMTWGLLLALTRRLNECQKGIRAGDWDRNKYLGTELNGKTIGIVGLGRTGQRVARIAQAFQMNVVAHDPYQFDEPFAALKIQRLSLEEVLRHADVVSLHIPLTKETHHLMGEMFIDSMQDHAFLINTSRGPVVHEQALIKALENKKIAGAGLDVFEYEPLMRESALFKFQNVVLSPHVGATTQEAFLRASDEAAQKVISFYEKGELKDSLPPNAPWYQE